jgi:hypothetical protein
MKMHGAEGVSAEDIAMLTQSLVGGGADVHVETEKWKGRPGSPHDGKSVHSIFLTSPTLLKRANWLLNVVGGKLWKDGIDRTEENFVPDWVCQLPYLRTPAAMESMSNDMAKIYVGGTGDADSLTMSAYLLEANGGVLKEKGVEFFQIKSSDGSYRNFGFLSVLKSAASEIMGMAWPDMRGELMRMAPATDNAPGAVHHGGSLSSAKNVYANKAAMSDGMEVALQKLPHLYNKHMHGESLLDALETPRGMGILAKAVGVGLKDNKSWLVDAIMESFQGDMGKYNECLNQYNNLLSQVLVSVNTHLKAGIESDALDEMKRRKQHHDPSAGPMFTPQQIDQLGTQLRTDAARGTFAAMDQMQAHGNLHMHPNNSLPDLSPQFNRTFDQQANAIAAMTSSPVGNHIHEQAMQNQLTAHGFRPLLNNTVAGY